MRYCSALAYGKMDAEDLVQDVLLSAYQRWDKIEKKGQFLHYLIRSARNRAISKWRRKKFRAELLEHHDNKMLAKEVSPEVLLDIQILYRALDRLPDKQREAVILFEVTGFSMKEIAEIQECRVGAVKTRVSRARKALKSLLEERAERLPSMITSLKSIAL